MTRTTRSRLLALVAGPLVAAAASAQPATPYDLGHQEVVPYAAIDPVSGLPLLWEVSLLELRPLGRPSNAFRALLAASYADWIFSYDSPFPPPNGQDRTLSPGSLIVHEYNAVHEDAAHLVGADFFVEYAPGPNDPSGADVHWIQVVRSNHRLGFAHGTEEYTIDNNGAGRPFYDDGFPDHADPLGFSDEPRREDDMSHRWEAELFLVLDLGFDPGTGERLINVYDGVGWGWVNGPVEFASAPEPATVATLGAGLLALALRYGRGPRDRSRGPRPPRVPRRA